MRLLLLLALAARAAEPGEEPALFPSPVPTAELPTLPEAPLPTADACPAAAPLLPGQPAPYVDSRGRATCRAQVVPEAILHDLQRDAVRYPFWEAAAGSCADGRRQDRAWSESAVRYHAATAEQAAAESARCRRHSGAAFIGGSVFGAVVAIAAIHAAGQ